MFRVFVLLKIGLCLFVTLLLISCAQPQDQSKKVPILAKKQYIDGQPTIYSGIVYEPNIQEDVNYELDNLSFAEDMKKAYCVLFSYHCSELNDDLIVNDEILKFSTGEARITYGSKAAPRQSEFSMELQNAIDSFPTERILVQRDDTLGTKYVVNMQRGLYFYFERFEDARKLADDFAIRQQRQQREYDAHMANFATLAAQYRALPVKPVVTEEQRKFIVQADAFRRDPRGRAVEYFKKALEINPTSYPEAYSNIALLAAANGVWSVAISNMKKYLMLVPDAEDARGAQDKIYEWEGMIQERAR